MAASSPPPTIPPPSAKRARSALRAGSALVVLALCPSLAQARPAAERPAAASERGAKHDGERRVLVTFIGYRRLAVDTDQVYVELTESAEVQKTRTGRTLEFTIHGAKVVRRNNKNPLVASQFDSVVESARLVQSGKSVRLVIRLRAAAEPQTRVVPRSGGATLEVTLTRTNGPLPPDDAPKKKHKKKKPSAES